MKTIMKKTYKNPAIEVVKIETHKMLAESMAISSEKTSTMDSRGYDFDDEE